MEEGGVSKGSREDEVVTGLREASRTSEQWRRVMF